MKKIIFLLIMSIIACKKSAHISMMTATSMKSGLPFEILEGKNWQPEDNAEYVKIHMYLDEAIQLSGIKITSCSGEFSDTIHSFINFDEVIRHFDLSGKIAQVKLDSVLARSITLNFYKNKNICISNITLLDEKERAYQLITPKLVQGSVKASESGNDTSYSEMNLFDSRYEYSYASDKNSKGVSINFNFEEEQKIKSIKIWNGYQRSDIHCVENGRVKTFQISGDNDYKEKIELKDEMGSQIISLPKEFKGKNLKLTVEDFYPGKKYKGIVISELRFFDGKNYSLINPFSRVQSIAKKNREEFQKVSLEQILNKGLVGYEELSDSAANSQLWLRLRTDGSMFLEGKINTPNYEINSNQLKTVYALGNYEVKSIENNKIVLKIFGLLRETKSEEATPQVDPMDMGGDCNGCARDCNQVYNPDPNKTEKIFSEFIELEKISEDAYIIKNQKRSGNFDFTEAKLSIE